MRISHRGRFVFYSLPKTGSESVRAFLDPASDEPVVVFRKCTADMPFYSHMRPVEAQRIFQQRSWVFSEYLHVATVRNPWARIASLWRMMQRDRDFGHCPSFRDWVAMLVAGEAGRLGQPWQRWYHHGIMGQSDFLADETGKALVNRVFRLEDGLTALREVFVQRVDAGVLGPSVPHLNEARDGQDWRAVYDETSYDLVGDVFERDVMRFGYGSAT